jgi:hypothetical protein
MADKKKNVVTSLEEADKVGFLGTKVDPTPNTSYTISGVTAHKPTPETDEKAAEKAKARTAELEKVGDPGRTTRPASNPDTARADAPKAKDK